MRNSLRALLAASLSIWGMNAAAQPDEGSLVGELKFAVSCSLPAQQKFERAVAILHSFWYEEAQSAFADVIKTDPSCAMGYWGIAMSNWHPLWFPPAAEELSDARDAQAVELVHRAQDRQPGAVALRPLRHTDQLEDAIEDSAIVYFDDVVAARKTERFEAVGSQHAKFGVRGQR